MVCRIQTYLFNVRINILVYIPTVRDIEGGVLLFRIRAYCSDFRVPMTFCYLTDIILQKSCGYPGAIFYSECSTE